MPLRKKTPSLPPPRVKGVPQAIAHEVPGHDGDEDEEARPKHPGAVHEAGEPPLLRRLEARGLSLEDAYVLASACVDLKISQIVDAPNYTVSAFLPLDIFREA